MAKRAPRGVALGLAVSIAGFFAVVAPVAAQVAPPTVEPPTPTLPPPAASSSAAGTREAGEPLVGTFELAGGACDGAVNGSYFRMVQPNGQPSSGPFVENSDSPCDDKTYTPLAPGTDGGLTTRRYQPDPDPAFDSTGGGRADRITEPQRFYGVNFSTATNPTDPQTGTEVAAPEVSRDAGGRLSGDLRAFSAAWNNQHFNQGAPKPDGQRPGTTAGPTGTYDESSGAFTLEWTSQIVGGPFNNFTGMWHLEGTFTPSEGPTSQPTPSVASGGAEASPGPGDPAAPAGSEGSVSAASGGAPSGADDRPLAGTGPSFPAAVGLAALVAGVVGLAAVRRAGRSDTPGG